MNIIQEIEKARKRILDEVNAEFDMLQNNFLQSENIEFTEQQKSPYEIQYPLIAGPKLFKGKKPTGVILNDKRIDVRTWKQVVEVILMDCISNDTYKKALIDNADKVSGKKRILLSCQDTEMRSPLKICKELYIETHYDTETLLNILMTRVLSPIGYDYSNIIITIRNT